MIPGSAEWNKVMTASKVAAVLGVANPNYSSPRALWHTMRNEVPHADQTKVQARGHFLEPAIIAWWKTEHREFAVFREHPTFKLGDWAAATPELLAGPDLMTAASYRDGAVLVEAKSARDLDEWGVPGTDVIPTSYLVQCYWQLHLAGLETCYVPMIGPFLDFAEYVVTYDAEVGSQLEQRCRAFFDSLEGDEPPPLDDTPATYEVIRAMHKGIEMDAVASLTPDQAREYTEACLTAKAAEQRATGAKSMVLDAMGDARYAKCGSVVVARRQPGRGGSVSLYPTLTSTDQLPESEHAA